MFPKEALKLHSSMVHPVRKHLSRASHIPRMLLGGMVGRKACSLPWRIDHKAVYNTTCENVLDLSMQSKGEAKYEECQWEHLVRKKWVLIWALRKVWHLDWVSSHTHRSPRLGMAWWGGWQVSREESPGPGVMNSGVHPTSAANGQSTLGVTSCVWSSVSLSVMSLTERKYRWMEDSTL